MENRLLPASQEIKVFAKQTEKVAEDLEQAAKTRSRCSPKCVVLAVLGVLALFGLGAGLYFVLK